MGFISDLLSENAEISQTLSDLPDFRRKIITSRHKSFQFAPELAAIVILKHSTLDQEAIMFKLTAIFASLFSTTLIALTLVGA